MNRGMSLIRISICFYGGMRMENRTVAFSESAGAAAIYTAAVFLNFVYRLSGGSTLAMIFGAVNESVWEHVKIFTAAYCLWALLQLCWLGVPFRRYVAAKCAGLYALMGLMIGFFCICSHFSGTATPAIDVIGSLLITAAAQLVSFLLLTGNNHFEDLFHPALMLLLLYYLMLFSFTVFPPKLGLFRDPGSGAYGIAGLRIV